MTSSGVGSLILIGVGVVLEDSPLDGDTETGCGISSGGEVTSLACCGRVDELEWLEAAEIITL